MEPFTERQLEAVRAGTYGRQDTLIRRLIATIESLTADRTPETNGNSEVVSVSPQRNKRDPVLILQHDDGFIEAFADPARVTIKILQPWNSVRYAEGTVDEQVERLPRQFADLHRDDYKQDHAYPRYRSRPGDWRRAALDRYSDLVAAGVAPIQQQQQARAIAATVPDSIVARDMMGSER